VVNVAATSSTGARASFSNYGSAVTLAAPGVGIYSTWNAGTQGPAGHTVTGMSGTSMAAPHVSGVAALLVSASPALTPDQVRAGLTGSAKAFPGACSGCGAGLLDAGRALAGYVVTPPPTAAPVVTKLSANRASAVGGATLVVSGSTLANATAVMFGDVQATITARTATALTVVTPTLPPASPAAVHVRVVTTGGTSATSRATAFAYLAPVPTVTSMTPRKGSPAGGETIVLTGRNLATAQSVTVAGVATPFTVVEGGALRLTAPAMAVGGATRVGIVVANAWTSGRPVVYSYVIPMPQVTSLSARVGARSGGTAVTLTGRNLSTATEVRFGQVSASTFTKNPDGTLTVRAPSWAPGSPTMVRVVVVNRWASSPQAGVAAFRYL
jgi:hypothetical protein